MTRLPVPFVRAVYDRRAAAFDRFVDVASLGQDGPMRERFVAELRVRPGAIVLDVGYGTGRDGPHLRRVGARIIGIDVSREMLRRAKADLLVQADAARLPIKSKSCDGVLATYLLSTAPWERAVDEMARVSKGRIVVSEDRLPPGWYLGIGPMLRQIARTGWSGIEPRVLRRLRAARRGSMLFGLIWWGSGTA